MHKRCADNRKQGGKGVFVHRQSTESLFAILDTHKDLAGVGVGWDGAGLEGREGVEGEGGDGLEGVEGEGDDGLEGVEDGVHRHRKGQAPPVPSSKGCCARS